MRTMRAVDAVLEWAGLKPPPGARGRPAEEVISDIEEREGREVEKLHQKVEKARRREGNGSLSLEGFMRAIDAENVERKRDAGSQD